MLVDEQHQNPVKTEPVPPTAGTEPLTLFVTQAERIDALYGNASYPSDEFPSATHSAATCGRPFEHIVLPALQAACASDLVRGIVVSVPSTIYDDWDAAPWKTTLANDVTERIRTYIQPYLDAHKSIKYVVMVGSDEVLPQRRVPDQTVLLSATSAPTPTPPG